MSEREREREREITWRPLVYDPPVLHADDTVMFWGIPYYNDVLLQYGESGNVQTEMLLHKDEGEFTFDAGWTFPRRVLFNGIECVMAPPDQYPPLPSSATLPVPSLSLLICIFCILGMQSGLFGGSIFVMVFG